jgi:hypothetical protein
MDVEHQLTMLVGRAPEVLVLTRLIIIQQARSLLHGPQIEEIAQARDIKEESIR